MTHSTRTSPLHQEFLPDNDVKTCRVCGRELNRTEFYPRQGSPDGLRNDCKDCTKIRSQQSAARNSEKRKEYMRQYSDANRDRLNEQARIRAIKTNRKLYFRRYRSNNRQTVLENERRYRVQNRHKQAARQFARRAMPLDSTATEYLRILHSDICSFCGKPAGTIDHIVPVAKGGTNDWDNLTAACPSCNSRKHDRSLLLFVLELHDE